MGKEPPERRLSNSVLKVIHFSTKSTKWGDLSLKKKGERKNSRMVRGIGDSFSSMTKAVFAMSLAIDSLCIFESFDEGKSVLISVALV